METRAEVVSRLIQSARATASADRYVPLRSEQSISLVDLIRLEHSRHSTDSEATLLSQELPFNPLFGVPLCGRFDPSFGLEGPGLSRHVSAGPFRRLLNYKRVKHTTIESVEVGGLSKPNLSPQLVLHAEGMCPSLSGNRLDVSPSDLIALHMKTAIFLYSKDRGVITEIPITRKISSIRFTPGGSQLLYGENFGKMLLFDVVASRQLWSRRFLDKPIATRFRDQFVSFVVGQRGSISLADIREKGQLGLESSFQNNGFRCADYTSLNDRLICGDFKGALTIYDPRNLSTSESTMSLEAGPINSVVFSNFRPSQIICGTQGPKRSLTLCNILASSVMKSQPTESDIFDIAASNCDEKVVCAFGPGKAEGLLGVFDLNLKELMQTDLVSKKTPSSRPLRLCVFADGERVAATYSSEEIKVWKLFEKRKKVPNSVHGVELQMRLR